MATSTKNPTVKGKNGKTVDYSVGPTPQVTAINKARAQNIADGKDAYAGAGAKGQVGNGGGAQYEPGTEGMGPGGKGIPVRNDEQQNPDGYYGTPENQFPNTPQNPRSPSGYDSVIPDGMYKGLTKAQAQARMKEQATQVSSLTTYGFNPATVSGAKKTFEGFNAKLNETNNDPWTSKGSKKEKLTGIYESTANEFAKLFDSQEGFDSLLATDADFAAGMDAFKRAGGDLNSIRQRIAPPTVSADAERESQRQAIEGLIAQGLGEPQAIADAMNEAGRASGINSAFTADEVNSIITGENNQSTADYLAGLSTTAPAGTTAETDAFNSLIPERQLAQDQIMRLASVPAQYKDIYFGTPEAVGILEEKRIQAEEQKKILEKKEKSDERNVRAAANLAIDKNNADLAIEEAQVEENRLAAKNYATGMLAKLGALNTTGAAPVKLATLEQKYQQQAQQLRSTTRYANQSIELKLKESVSDIEIKTDQDILDVQADFTKEKEDVLKEVQKLEQTAWDKIYSITDKAAGELRTQREKYSKEAKALAEKNAKAYAKEAASYDVGKLGGKITGGTEAERLNQRIAQYQDAFTPGQFLDDGTPTIDPDGFITVTAWKEALKEAPSMGISRKQFIENFGSQLYLDDNGVPDKAYGLTAKELGYLEA